MTTENLHNVQNRSSFRCWHTWLVGPGGIPFPNTHPTDSGNLLATKGSPGAPTGKPRIPQCPAPGLPWERSPRAPRGGLWGEPGAPLCPPERHQNSSNS